MEVKSYQERKTSIVVLDYSGPEAIHIPIKEVDYVEMYEKCSHFNPTNNNTLTFYKPIKVEVIRVFSPEIEPSFITTVKIHAHN